MRIGILTYYKVGNVGAILQAVSTYNYLTRQGHEVVFLWYLSRYTDYSQTRSLKVSQQMKVHIDFINAQIPIQTEKLYGSSDIEKAIRVYRLEAVIIGSDAVLQHFPRFSTLKWGQGLKAWLRPIQAERRFPNPFWGCGLIEKLPVAMISVSSQNSPYRLYSSATKERMAKSLMGMKYISVRDAWTQQLVEAVCPSLTVDVTPDPVFAFNQNAGHLVPDKEDILRKFGLEENYTLVGLRNNVLSDATLAGIEKHFISQGVECVSFPIGGNVSLPFKKKITYPISPIDWYALLKYAKAYIGSNMHPIVVSLHNAIPCFSIDNWGTTDFWGRRLNDGSSKVQDILSRYGLELNRKEITNGQCAVTSDEILEKLDSFPAHSAANMSALQYTAYCKMMDDCLKSLR